jgi:CrcB protein
VGRFLLICLGGALGTGARFLISTWAAQTFGSGFPRGTIFINITGSFLIAVVMELSLSTGVIGQTPRLFLTTGIMGGYTTYSSFNYETLKLASDGAYDLAALYLALTVVGCLVAGLLGGATARGIIRLGGMLAG